MDKAPLKWSDVAVEDNYLRSIEMGFNKNKAA